MTLCELGCGSGWITRLAARHGVHAEGYDISPEMIEIARELAAQEGLDAHFETGDMEQLDLGRRFDSVPSLRRAPPHPARRPRLSRARTARSSRAGGCCSPSRTGSTASRGAEASEEYGVDRARLHAAPAQAAPPRQGFTDIRRFHNTRKRLFSNAPRDVAAPRGRALAYRALGPFWTQIWLRASAS